MSDAKPVPTLYEWMGGLPALERLMAYFYERVPADPLLGPVFGLPADPEFRSAFVAYLEWGTRLAVINSRPGADVEADQPMPAWGWGEVKGPYTGPT